MNSVEIEGLQLQLRTARTVCDGSVRVPNRAGVYFIAVELTSPLLRLGQSGHYTVRVTGSEFAIIYVGETWAVKNRLLEHLVGDWKVSNFRHSVLALQQSLSSDSQSDSEESLSKQLLRDAVVGFCEPDFVGPAERALINALQPAFNIRGCHDAAWKRELQKVRKIFSAGQPLERE